MQPVLLVLFYLNLYLNSHRWLVAIASDSEDLVGNIAQNRFLKKHSLNEWILREKPHWEKRKHLPSFIFFSFKPYTDSHWFTSWINVHMSKHSPKYYIAPLSRSSPYFTLHNNMYLYATLSDFFLQKFLKDFNQFVV